MPVAPPQMAVSIIIPFFNAEEYLERCLRGLHAQEMPERAVEILMVDNNSTDRGPEIVRGDPRVRLLQEARQGAYAARNRGIAEARGQLLVFLDPDCVPQAGWLPALVGEFRDPGVQMVVGRVDPGGGSYALRLLGAYENQKLVFAFGTDRPSMYSGYGGNMAVRRDALDTTGRFVEDRRGGDTLLVIRAAELFGCDAVRYVPHARVSHLEVMTLGTFYRKFFVYGRSRRRHTSSAAPRPLSRAERTAIVRQAVGSESRPLLASASLFALLAAGVGFFRAGAMSSRWSHAGR